MSILLFLIKKILSWFPTHNRSQTYYELLNHISPNTKQPVIIITVYRRFFELINNIKLINKIKNKLSVKPIIVIIWAQPLDEHRYIFTFLKEKNYVDLVIPRPLLHNEGIQGATTYPESFNIRQGLEFVKTNFPSSYCVVTAADAFIDPDMFLYIDRLMQDGCPIIGSHWSDSVQGSIKTSFFVVNMDELLWPPLSRIDSKSTLETQWAHTRNPVINPIYIDVFGSHDYDEQIRWLSRCRK